MARTPRTVNQAIRRAQSIVARGAGYSMGDDGGIRGSTMDAPTYDCSSFIGTVWSVGEGGWPPATPSMVAEYTARGFKHYTRGSVALKRGDILVYNGPSGGTGADGHTAMVYDKACTILIECTGSQGAHIGNGVYYFGWQDILRGTGGTYIEHWTPTDGIQDGF